MLFSSFLLAASGMQSFAGVCGYPPALVKYAADTILVTCSGADFQESVGGSRFVLTDGFGGWVLQVEGEKQYGVLRVERLAARDGQWREANGECQFAAFEDNLVNVACLLQSSGVFYAVNFNVAPDQRDPRLP